MEEKKLDINSIIGFIAIFGILMYMLWQNQPTPEELEAQEKAKQEQVEAEQNQQQQAQPVSIQQDFTIGAEMDSLQLVDAKNKLGAFSYSAMLAASGTEETVVETD